MKRFDIVNHWIQKNKDEILALGHVLLACPELGFKEVKTKECITSFLCKNQIPYKENIAITGVMATIGEGEDYRIGIVADMDGLVIGSGAQAIPIHSCGHSIQVAVMLNVLKVLKDGNLLEGLNGKVSFIATPAEEFIDLDYRRNLIHEKKLRYSSGKQTMISEGVFDGIDCVISAHINGEVETLFDINSTLAGFLVKKAIFHGMASHSGAAPHLGKNALHGASLCMQAISFIKDQFSKEAGIQIHPILTEGGSTINIIPDRAVLETYVRVNDKDNLFEVSRKFDLCVVHCAKALGLDYEIINETGYMPLKQSEAINKIVYQNMLNICDNSKILKNIVSGASGDIGDVGFLLPCVQFGFSGIEGRIHSSEFRIINPENVYCNTTSVIVNTILDLLEQKELQVKNKQYEKDKQYYLKQWLNQAPQ